MKKLIIILAVLVFNPHLYSQSFSFVNAGTYPEEKFYYDVSWLFIHIGTITLSVKSIDGYPELKKIILQVKTAHGLPFINIDEYNEAVMRTTDGMTLYYHGTEEHDGVNINVTCRYFEKGNYTLYEEKDIKTGRLIKKDTVMISKPYLIGTSLIEYARLIADSGLKTNVPTLLRGRFYPTIIDYCGPAEFIKLDNYYRPISAFKYTGTADWQGKATAGLSGKFTGWLSNDQARVVVFAKLHLFLGSVNVELTKWYKPGWIPPADNKFIADENNE